MAAMHGVTSADKLQFPQFAAQFAKIREKYGVPRVEHK